MSSFRAMNTDIAVSTPGLTAEEEAALAGRVARLFEEAEQRFSRFRPDSELSRVNRVTTSRVSPPMFDALARARAYVELTGGVFDPGIGRALSDLGYDRSFTPGGLDRAGGPPPGPAASLLEVELCPGDRTVRRPAHVHIDLGGLIKGATVDAAAALLPVPGAVDAGGDARLRGAPSAEGWLVDVEDPLDPAGVLLTLRLVDRAVATSAGNRRRWQVGDRTVHHIIDPRSGREAASDLVQATVVAATAELADVLAKAAFVVGLARARELCAAAGATGAVLVTAAGTPVVIGDLEVVVE